MLTNLSCNILYHKKDEENHEEKQTVSLKKNAKETRFYAKLRPCSPVYKTSIGKQPDTLLSADEILLGHGVEKTVHYEKCKYQLKKVQNTYTYRNNT